MIVVGGGPSGMTTSLLLARAGHQVTLLERGRELGGLWACVLDADGFYRCENSCKVYQSSYHTSPALFEMIGTRWQEHFVPRHDLTTDWLRPFLADCSRLDLAKLSLSFARHVAGAKTYRDVSVGDYLEQRGMSEACKAWMRATALGGITGTLRMTMWELFHRLESNVGAVLAGERGVLHWNAQPPNSPHGFLTFWVAALRRAGVRVETGCGVRSISRDGSDPSRLLIESDAGERREARAVFLALPPPAMSQLLAACPDEIAGAFGRPFTRLERVLRESVYSHLGVTWTFDRELPRALPLGGHNVRRGWHPIVIEHPQYRDHLRPPGVTAVVGSVSVNTDLVHPRLGTVAGDHSHEELARILWEDERRVDPSLPEPIATAIYGVSSATQIVGHGPLPVRARGLPIYVATQLNGAAPYFTASLESAIQAGAAAAAAFDPRVERLPTGPGRSYVPFAKRLKKLASFHFGRSVRFAMRTASVRTTSTNAAPADRSTG